MFNLYRVFKNMPRGIELYSPLVGKCVLERVDSDRNIVVSFIDSNSEKRYPAFNGDFGFLKDCCNGKVMIFPDNTETWDNWQNILFKKGDYITYGCGFVLIYLNPIEGINANGATVEIPRLDEYTYASEREINDFNGALRLEGYKWNNVKKELEHIVEKPKFKVGEMIKRRNDNLLGPYVIVEITDTKYVFDDGTTAYIYNQGMYEHVKYVPIFEEGDIIKKRGSNKCYIIDSITDRCYVLKGCDTIVLFEFQTDWEPIYAESVDYCGYDNCKRLIELGFKFDKDKDMADLLEYYGFYTGANHDIVVFDDTTDMPEDCIRITQEAAIKWIRKVFGYEIGVNPVFDSDTRETTYIPYVKEYDGEEKKYVNLMKFNDVKEIYTPTCAIENAINFALNKCNKW